jgi:hypothetical protein
VVNSIVDAVTTQLGKTFGDNYHYYFENVEQNLTTPCFTVDLLIPTMRSRSAVLYDREMPLIIHYFSDSKTSLKRDCYNIAEQLTECLEYLPYDTTLLRGEEISWDIVDDVLQFFVTYEFITTKVDTSTEVMEELDVVEKSETDTE